MDDRNRQLPSWMSKDSVSSSTSIMNNGARSPVNENDREVKFLGSDNSQEAPSSSGTVGPLLVVYNREEGVDSCRNSNGETVSSEGDIEVVCGTSDDTANCSTSNQDEQVDSTSDGAAIGREEPDSSHDVSSNMNGNDEVESSGLNAYLEEVSSGQSTQNRDSCFYGSSCYRRNPQHRQEFSHPGDPDYVEPSSTSPRVLPVCKYGQGCYRRNPKHRSEYNHDVTPALRAARPTNLVDASQSTDEEDYSSSDDYSPGLSETDDSFVVSDSNASESEEQSPSKGNGSSKKDRKQSKRKRKDGDKARKKPNNDQ